MILSVDMAVFAVVLTTVSQLLTGDLVTSQ